MSEKRKALILTSTPPIEAEILNFNPNDETYEVFSDKTGTIILKKEGIYVLPEIAPSPDTSLQTMLSQTISSVLSSENLATIIQTTITKAIEKSIANCFEYNHKSKKLLDEKIETVMVSAIEKNDFNKYLIKLDDTLTTIINNTTFADNAALLQNFKELMTEPNKNKDYTVSDLFAAYKRFVADKIDTSGLSIDYENETYCPVHCEMTVEILPKNDNSSFTYANIFFTCNEDEFLDTELHMYHYEYNKGWKFINLPEKLNINGLRHLSDFQILTSRLARANTEIIMDRQYDVDDIEPNTKPEYQLI